MSESETAQLIVFPSIKFNHDLLPSRKVPGTIVPGIGRLYNTPDGVFPSVTTLLGRIPDANNPNWKAEWEARVGKEEADRVSGRARSRGTSIHGIAERYVLNDPHWARGVMPVNMVTFSGLRPILDARLHTVLGTEVTLWSRRLRVAGTSDLICSWDTDLRGMRCPKYAIVDYKGANWAKDRVMITKHFLQAGCYGTMVRETYGINIEVLVVIILVEHDQPQVFEESYWDWAAKVEAVFVDPSRASEVYSWPGTGDGDASSTGEGRE